MEQEAVSQATRESMPDASLKLQRALPVIVLSDHSALSTAFANDVSPELVFAQQVVGYGRKGDVYLGISTSGNARNVLLAAQVAKARGLTVVGLTGGTGGKLTGIADEAVIVKGNCPADVQELHLPAYHALCAMLEEHFFGAGEAD
jgi:D-sedoheptulose 7-phosphate isomerase